MNQKSSQSLSKAFKLATTALSLMIAGGASVQAANLVLNGGFEDITPPGVSAEVGSNYPSHQITDWTSTGYNFVFTPGTADTTGAINQYNQQLLLWGPGNPGSQKSDNGLTATSPAGGNFVAMDGAYEQGPITQMIHGLRPGYNATLTFYFAAAQQHGYSGNTDDQFQVSLGSETEYTAVLHDANHGFVPWTQVTMKFTPTSASELLSFFAIGHPGGEPPFALLDGVSLSNAPEPGSLALAALGLIGIGIAGRAAKKVRRQPSADI